jgi:hypothetical protein
MARRADVSGAVGLNLIHVLITFAVARPVKRAPNRRDHDRGGGYDLTGMDSRWRHSCSFTGFARRDRDDERLESAVAQ